MRLHAQSAEEEEVAYKVVSAMNYWDCKPLDKPCHFHYKALHKWLYDNEVRHFDVTFLNGHMKVADKVVLKNAFKPKTLAEGEDPRELSTIVGKFLPMEIGIGCERVLHRKASLEPRADGEPHVLSEPRDDDLYAWRAGNLESLPNTPAAVLWFGCPCQGKVGPCPLKVMVKVFIDKRNRNYINVEQEDKSVNLKQLSKQHVEEWQVTEHQVAECWLEARGDAGPGDAQRRKLAAQQKKQKLQERLREQNEKLRQQDSLEIRSMLHGMLRNMGRMQSEGKTHMDVAMRSISQNLRFVCRKDSSPFGCILLQM
eukprot:gene3716-4656_t